MRFQTYDLLLPPKDLFFSFATIKRKEPKENSPLHEIS